MNRSRSRGAKRSSWLTFRRRLLLVRLLLRGPTTSADLVAAVQAELGDEGYPISALVALRHDLTALKNEYGCLISYQRSTGRYQLSDLGELALLDLPDCCLEALAFLDASFPAGASLAEHASVRDLLDRLLLLLPPRRREQRQQRTLSLLLAQRPSSRIDAQNMERLKRAQQRQEITFLYQSPSDPEPRQHRVAPYGIFFRPEGHGYLDATLLETTPPGPEPRYAAISYRLDRIVAGSVQILPQVLPPQRQLPPRYRLRYWLRPVVAARRDITAYFPDTEITYHDDGSATITATITNLWQAWQIVLRYGENCLVQEPPELAALLRTTAREMSALYGGEER